MLLIEAETRATAILAAFTLSWHQERPQRATASYHGTDVQITAHIDGAFAAVAHAPAPVNAPGHVQVLAQGQVLTTLALYGAAPDGTRVRVEAVVRQILVAHFLHVVLPDGTPRLPAPHRERTQKAQVPDALLPHAS